MSSFQPTGDTKLSDAPTHSKLHRVVGIDASAPDDSLRVQSDGTVETYVGLQADEGITFSTDGKDIQATSVMTIPYFFDIDGVACDFDVPEGLVFPGHTPGFHDRGDVGAFDWAVGDFTTDGNWNSLDCSSIVPKGARAILFRCHIKDDAAGSVFSVRKRGNSNDHNAGYFRTQVANVDNDTTMLVPCGDDRLMEYKTSNLAYVAIDVLVMGWII